MLAGDNAIIVGMASAGLAPSIRYKVIFMGIALATIMRIIFALIATQLLQIVGLLLTGGLLLLWVSWKLWRELEQKRLLKKNNQQGESILREETPQKTTRDAIIQIVIADITMSLDNILAVAGISREYPWILVIGLVVSVAFMGIAATWIARLLDKRPWIGYIGLVSILYVALSMMYEGWNEICQAIGCF